MFTCVCLSVCLCVFVCRRAFECVRVVGCVLTWACVSGLVVWMCLSVCVRGRVHA